MEMLITDTYSYSKHSHKNKKPHKTDLFAWIHFPQYMKDILELLGRELK